MNVFYSFWDYVEEVKINSSDLVFKVHDYDSIYDFPMSKPQAKKTSWSLVFEKHGLQYFQVLFWLKHMWKARVALPQDCSHLWFLGGPDDKVIFFLLQIT